MSDYYDRAGAEISAEEWTRLVRDRNYRYIAKTDFGDGCSVSTVWLGLDHSFGHGPPLIFETMVFGPYGGGEMDRYATEAQARIGHANMVRKYEIGAAFNE